MIELVLLVWVLVMATLWFARYLFDEAVAAYRGQTSPRVARREARERLAREWGVPTVGQAVSGRLARWIDEPPERRWAANLRAFLAELADDAVAEARVRHHRARQQRRGGWKVRTGGPSTRKPPPPPPAAPEPDDDVMDARPCRGCDDALVVAPDDYCEACEQAAPPPPDTGPADDEPPATPAEDDTPTEGDDMANTATHKIDGDVRDPRTALAFATACREMNDGVARELDLLAANLERQNLGSAPIGEVRVLADAARTFSASSRKSVEAYASHVVTQADIAGDDDLRNTVRRTYLDTRGSDAAPAPKGSGKTRTLSAADCDNPTAAAALMKATADTYVAMQASVDQAKGKHEQQGVSDDPVRFLAEQLELATTLATQAKRSAATFRRHVQRRDDTVGKDASLRGTQDGKYLSTAKA